MSVIVPTYNRRLELEDCLNSLGRQRFKDFEIVVVDDGSTDSTGEAVRTFNVRYHKVSHGGVVKALNFGVSLALGEIIAIMDDDCVASEDWLVMLVSAYTNAVGGVGGRILDWRGASLNTAKIVGKVLDDGRTTANFDSGGNLREVDYIKGGNMSFRKNLLQEAGLFDSNYLGDGFNFEPDICLRIKRRGARILYEPGAVVWHLRAPRPGRVHRTRGILRNYYWNRNSSYFYFKNMFPYRGLGHFVRRQMVFTGRSLGNAVLRRDVSSLYGVIGTFAGFLSFLIKGGNSRSKASPLP